MALKILCVGDMHLGKSASRLPEALEDHGIHPRDLTPAATWQRICDRAVAERVDAVVLAGDVVEDEDERFAAFSHLDLGIRSLVEHDIQVVGVAGNHDGTALPRLARQLNGFRLLGESGQWENLACTAHDGTPFEILGWSFPEREYAENPFDRLGHQNPPVGLRLGLLHADLDGGTASPYAPVTRTDLERAQCDVWCMGHIHMPSEMNVAPHAGYLGNTIGLDPGEAGRRGPWLLNWDAKNGVRLRHLGLAPLRWESLVISLDKLPRAPRLEDMQDIMQSAFLAAADQMKAAWTPDDKAIVVGCRLRIEGRSQQHALAMAAAQALRGVPFQCGGVLVFAEHIVDAGRQALDLESIARTRTPPGRLARQILSLQAGTPEADALLDSTREALADWGSRAQWREASRKRVLSEDELRQRLIVRGLSLLESMLAQKEFVKA
ncbi:MAG: DNA repair exonuclease [Verrucomicrobia bacterium]|nr:DNA repair exonuclease [Verrucomicrobiota bacterium]